MKPSCSLRGAQRFPMNSKQGNKDYYKGTRQAYVPGAGVRTGAPGVHVGRGKYKLMDDKVRVFVAPHREVLEGTSLRPYVDHAYFSPQSEHLVPDPYSAFAIFQRHAQKIAKTTPDLRSRWQVILDQQAESKVQQTGSSAQAGSIEEEEEPVLRIGSDMDPNPLAESSSSSASVSKTRNEDSIESFDPSSSATTAEPSSSITASSKTNHNIKWDDREEYDDPDRLSDDLEDPANLDAPLHQVPISEMDLVQMDALQVNSPPSETWTEVEENRYQELKWKYLVKPPMGTINPIYWDHWKTLSEEQKEAYKFIGRRIWWDVCTQKLREKTAL